MPARRHEKRLDMTLADRLVLEEGWVYLTGMQALVRLPLQQRRRDIAAGLNTGGFISGYRGSPLGRYDMELWEAEQQLRALNVHFQPGINEDIAATAAWGSQQVGLFPGARVDGVFSIWYGKAPGLDRSMDPIRHANLAGTNRNGGSLLLVGDDHGAKSSSVACYSDYNFVSLGLPLLAPANAQEVLDYGLHGIAMSRHSGTLVGMKLVTDVIEGGGSVWVAPDSPKIEMPQSDAPHPGIRPFVSAVDQERILWDQRLKRATEYARTNGLNRIKGSARARLGIVAAGKAWQDLSQALAGLGYAGGKLGELEVRLLKVGMVWPLDERAVRDFADGLDTIVVVEEKRPLLEDQIRSFLYGAAHQPRLIGKTFGAHVFAQTAGETAFPDVGEIDPGLVARILARAAMETDPNCGIALPNAPDSVPASGAGVDRMPSFCAGCPHGRSTQMIDGSRALAGIGCHGMAMARDPDKTNSMSQMGGEGAIWIGQHPFTDETHVFANMGDGTYFHSGILAIRAAVAAKVPITYKLLHNGFVSMTGGQPVEGDVTPQSMIRQLKAEGVGRIALVADEPDKYRNMDLGEGVTLHERSELDAVSRELREIPGVTALIYDQPCATERRRLRKRGKWEDPDKRVFIHPEVCEGCGDCSTVSQCMAIEPLETEFGRKRQINQSACNKDFSCVEGFCPSFVTLSGATPRKAKRADGAIDVSGLPTPEIGGIDGSWSILVSGIGGAGVVTVGQTLAVAAHADGYFVSNLDITGLAQKYGAVHSHIKIGAHPYATGATRIAAAEADALIGCDLVVATGDEALSRLNPDRAVAVIDTTVVPTSDFSRNPDWRVDAEAQVARMSARILDRARPIDAQVLAEKVLGDRLFANMLLVGAAWQQGGIPISLEAIQRAIELNAVQIERNKQAFDLGRLAYADRDRAARLMQGDAANPVDAQHEQTLPQIIARRVEELTAYQNAAYARRYSGMLEKAQGAGLDLPSVTAIARGYHKLLATKDEWEVARLFSKPSFRKALGDEFEGDLKLTYYFGAWPFAKADKQGGRIQKGAVPEPWVTLFFGLMNRFRRLRGTVLDPFRNSEEARLARRLLADYEDDIDLALAHCSEQTAADIAELLALPEQIRGYGHVRERHARAVAPRRASLRAAIAAGGAKRASEKAA